MNWKRFAGKSKAAWQVFRGRVYPSFSQAGEDQIVRYLFECLRLGVPSYLDIGCNHPFMGNNTYFFYLRGGRGVCIEPDPVMAAKIRKFRPKDKLLVAGIGLLNGSSATYYRFPDPYSGWNTFSAENAEEKQKETGIKFIQMDDVPLVTVNEVLEKHFDRHPNFVSIDIEGLDYQILQSIDFSRYRPEVFCVETISFSMENKEEKVTSIIDFMQGKGYFVFGDSHINTIFCSTDIYNKL